MPSPNQTVRALFSHHKCATTFTQQIVGTVARATSLRLYREYISTRLPLGYQSAPDQRERIRLVNEKISARNYDILFHGNADKVAFAAIAGGGPLRAVHIIRDPRDILVSGYFWHLSSHSQADTLQNPWTGERRRRLLEVPDKETGLILNMEFSDCYFAAMREWDYERPDILELRYEDMISDIPAFVSNILAFWELDLPNHTNLYDILAPLTFERLSDGRHVGQEDATHKYRKGVVGDWRNHFTPLTTDIFKERYGELLIQLGYERNLDWNP